MNLSRPTPKRASTNRSSLLDLMSSQRKLKRRSKRTTMSTSAGTKLSDRSALTRPYVRTRKRRGDWKHDIALSFAFVGTALLWMTM